MVWTTCQPARVNWALRRADRAKSLHIKRIRGVSIASVSFMPSTCHLSASAAKSVTHLAAKAPFGSLAHYTRVTGNIRYIRSNGQLAAPRASRHRANAKLADVRSAAIMWPGGRGKRRTSSGKD